MHAGQTTLEFPEIEGISPSSAQETDDAEMERKRKQFKGKRRFNAFAKRVIGQLAIEKEASQRALSRSNSKTNLAADSDLKLEKKFQKPPLRTAKSFASQSNSNVRTSSRALQTQCSLNGGDEAKRSFASIVRMERSRRLAKADVTSISVDQPEDVPEELPTCTTPRFSATLSAEAQYAMLKGYEDVLRDNLTSGETKACNSRRMVRVKTPRRNVISLQLNDNEAQLTAHDKQLSGDICYGSELDRRSPQQSSSFECNTSMSSEILSRVFPRPGESQMPKQTQLRLSKRFQSAMSLLDRLKDPDRSPTQLLATSTDTANVDSYNSWSRSWVREFKLEFPTTS